MLNHISSRREQGSWQAYMLGLVAILDAQTEYQLASIGLRGGSIVASKVTMSQEMKNEHASCSKGHQLKREVVARNESVMMIMVTNRR